MARRALRTRLVNSMVGIVGAEKVWGLGHRTQGRAVLMSQRRLGGFKQEHQDQHHYSSRHSLKSSLEGCGGSDPFGIMRLPSLRRQ
jgi:hypothetical protein